MLFIALLHLLFIYFFLLEVRALPHACLHASSPKQACRRWLLELSLPVRPWKGPSLGCAFFPSFLFFWLLWMPEYNLAYHQDILSWCWQVPSSVLLQCAMGDVVRKFSCLGERMRCLSCKCQSCCRCYRRPPGGGRKWVHFHCMPAKPLEKNTTGFFKVCCEQWQCMSVINLRPSESMGFRNVMIAVFKRQ